MALFKGWRAEAAANAGDAILRRAFSQRLAFAYIENMQNGAKTPTCPCLAVHRPADGESLACPEGDVALAGAKVRRRPEDGSCSGWSRKRSTEDITD